MLISKIAFVGCSYKSGWTKEQVGKDLISQGQAETRGPRLQFVIRGWMLVRSWGGNSNAQNRSINWLVGFEKKRNNDVVLVISFSKKNPHMNQTGSNLLTYLILTCIGSTFTTYETITSLVKFLPTNSLCRFSCLDSWELTRLPIGYVSHLPTSDSGVCWVSSGSCFWPSRVII